MFLSFDPLNFINFLLKFANFPIFLLDVSLHQVYLPLHG